jgi:hypothetical protein
MAGNKHMPEAILPALISVKAPVLSVSSVKVKYKRYKPFVKRCQTTTACPLKEKARSR